MTPRLAAALLCAVLAGCASVPPTTTGEAIRDPQRIAQAQAQLQAHEQALGLADGRCDAPAWAMSGRAALSNGRDGGSGRIEWRQGDGRTQVTLSAPVTRQSWTLTADAGGAVLEGVPDGPRKGADAGQLLQEVTGWEIPVAALGCWLRGARANADQHGVAEVGFGADLRPLRIQQDGWDVEYAEWAPDASGQAALPTRISAQRGENRVRLVIDDWAAQ